MMRIIFFFFFSSRRRHTRLTCDWSSDVCSSDLLNASNARTYRLGWRTAAGTPVPFTLIGNDGGLLPAPRDCTDAYLASAERLDVLLDLSDLEVGDALFLETRAFDPMHMETAGRPSAAAQAAPAADYAAMGHAARAPDPHA